MPFFNGRFYLNPTYGRALERARAADAPRPPTNRATNAATPVVAAVNLLPKPPVAHYIHRPKCGREISMTVPFMCRIVPAVSASPVRKRGISLTQQLLGMATQMLQLASDKCALDFGSG